MTTLVEISKRRGPVLTPEQRAQQKRERTQARVGLASNALGLTAGAAATGAALRDERFEHGGRIAQRLFKIGNAIPKPIKNLNDRLGVKGKAALAGGALALQAGNMGGDVVANRVLARSAQKQPVAKDYNAESMVDIYVSKKDRTKGHGSLESPGRDKQLRMDQHAERMKTGKLAHKDFQTEGHFKWSAVKKAEENLLLSKAYRRYDPEADRQRRLGLASGAGLLGAGLLGSGAARRYTTATHSKEGERLIGVAVKRGKGRGALLLTTGALASGGLGAAAYRRGLSERNNPWN